jgi:L-ascorbate metabolism protein UlaG (beta-lactamase superfamily)
MQITFLGHACFELEHAGTRVLIDPFLAGNPRAARHPDALEPDLIVVTHGHQDHLGDTVPIARRTGAAVLAIVEVARELQDELGDGATVHGPNLGGTVGFDWGWVKLVPAWHTSTTPRGTTSTPAGAIVNLGGRTIYHLGDTALFGDLELIGRRHGPIDVALMCIGGHYTMDRHDAVVAAELLGARRIIPCHYDTFPPIATDAQAFKAEVERATSSEVILLNPGEVHAL